MEENEKGFIQIPRTIGNRLKKMLPAEMGCYLHILDKTLSYGKEEDQISYGQLAKATGHSLRMVKLALQNLEARKMVAIRRQLGRGHKNEPNMIRVESPDIWVVKRISDQYRKLLERMKNSYRKSASKGGEGKQTSGKTDGGSEKNAQRVVKRIDGGSEKNPHIDKQREDKELNKEILSEPENNGSDESLFLPSKEEGQNLNQEGEQPVSTNRMWPLFLEKQREERLERERKLSGLKRPKGNGLTDEEIRLTFGNRIEPEKYRELTKGKSHKEILDIQSQLINTENR